MIGLKIAGIVTGLAIMLLAFMHIQLLESKLARAQDSLKERTAQFEDMAYQHQQVVAAADRLRAAWEHEAREKATLQTHYDKAKQDYDAIKKEKDVAAWAAQPVPDAVASWLRRALGEANASVTALPDTRAPEPTHQPATDTNGSTAQ